MRYSIRMRAAKGGAHEAGGRHISGAERMLSPVHLEETAAEMIRRALTHSRGQADFIRLTIEKVSEKEILYAPLLKIRTNITDNIEEGRRCAEKLLTAAGIGSAAVKAAFLQLDTLTASMRGAMLLCAATGERMDSHGQRGIRVSIMDIEKKAQFSSWLQAQNLDNLHVREAVILAAKAMASQKIVAELCWSDDPEYQAGYVATPQFYHRITTLKNLGSALGGRVFFVTPQADMQALQYYLEKTPVLVTCEKGGQSV